MDFNLFELLTHERMVFWAILSCGLYTSYTDFRYGKIANFYTAFLIGFGMISQIVFVSEGDITWIHSFVTLFGGLGISFVLFYTGIWAAGDAKLFWGISLLMPPDVFIYTPQTQFYPLILMINIFLLFLLYIILQAVFKMTFQQQKSAIVRGFVAQVKQFPRRLLKVLSYVGISGLAFYIPAHLGIELDVAIRITLFIMIAYAFNRVVEKYIPQKYMIAFHVPFLLLALCLAIPSLIQLGIFMVIIFVIPWFLIMFDAVVRSLFTEEVLIENLRPNMIPAERIVKLEEQNVSDKYVRTPAGFANPARDNVIVDVSSEGLTSPQIGQLHQLAAEGSLKGCENKLLIQKKIPFALMIASGGLVTILAKGMAYSFFRSAEIHKILEQVVRFFLD